MDINNRIADFNRHSSYDTIGNFNQYKHDIIRPSKQMDFSLNEQTLDLKAIADEQGAKIDFGDPHKPVSITFGSAQQKHEHDIRLIVSKIETIRADEKGMLLNAIDKSLSFSVGGIVEAGSLGIMQMNFELTYLNENYIPEEFQAQLQTEIERLTEERLKNHLDPMAEMARSFAEWDYKMNRMDKYEYQMQKAEQLERGTHYLQSLPATYREWFDELAASDSFAEDYEKLLKKFEDLEVSQSNGATGFAKANAKYVNDQLRTQWNAFSNALPNRQAPKVSTEDAPVFNFKV